MPVMFARCRSFSVAIANVQMPFQRPGRSWREDLEQGEVCLRRDPAGRVVVDLVDQLKMRQTSRGVLLEGPAAQFVERPGGNVAAAGVCRRPIADLSHGPPGPVVKFEHDMSSRLAGRDTTRVGLLYRVTDPVSGLAAVMLCSDPLLDLLCVLGGEAGPST